ncbi:MAG TPA: hypothetical protein PK671_15835 [Candidatus Obscuribacter sp.]|nr:hypothetical protein [Candidatus Obscuribacter sp.]
MTDREVSEIEWKAEEYDCVQMYLDDLDAPKEIGSIKLSLVGRIAALTTGLKQKEPPHRAGWWWFIPQSESCGPFILEIRETYPGFGSGVGAQYLSVQLPNERMPVLQFLDSRKELHGVELEFYGPLPEPKWRQRGR